MSINELNLILKKDHTINTWGAKDVQTEPERVETDYLVHAKTHLSLGDTAKYVDITFKWVSGLNKGTFIGAVLGDYGDGKTSFLVHLWAKSHEQKICAVPPFEWGAFEDIIEAVSSWTQYILKRDTRLDLAKRVEQIYQSFRQQTVKELAEETAKKQNENYEITLNIITGLVNSGKRMLDDMPASRLLDFIAEVSNIVSEGGYKGLLVLLDEPEVAAKKLGNETVQLFLFNLANELHRRQGNYGIFVSMPTNFYASAQSRFAALTARLEIRGCFPRLGDIYGPDFAENLWQRYVTEFELGHEGQSIVDTLTLQGIGQIGSSEYRELSFGPRSVISIFRRMVDEYNKTGKPYQVNQLVQDILDQEVLVKPDYQSKLRSVFNSPLANDENRDALTLLAIFPAGLHRTVINKFGFDEILRPLTRPDGLLYQTTFTMGLRALRKQNQGSTQTDPLRDMIEEISSEYTPDRRAFNNALSAFARDVVPLIFQTRKGQQLDNWQDIQSIKQQFSGVYFGTLLGSFPQSATNFPYRAVLLFIRGINDEWTTVKLPSLETDTGLQKYDFVFQIVLRWNASQPQFSNILEINEQNVIEVEGQKEKCPLIQINLDLTLGTLQQGHLTDIVGDDTLTPMWVLNLFERMGKEDFPRDVTMHWQGLHQSLSKQFLGLFFGHDFNSTLIQTVSTQFEEQLNGSGLQLLDRLSNLLLKRRYPEYQTLIRQPRWQEQINRYITALTSTEIPLACRRGRVPWLVDQSQEAKAAQILGTSRANLTGGAFTGFEQLIQITTKGRNMPLEVVFRLHSLEQAIREIIMSQPMGAERKFKPDGNKEAWYVSRSDLLPMILGNGYTIDELQKIIEIGKARQTFLETEHKKERVFYCLPLAPEELKIQLRVKLANLIAEIEDFKNLPDYRTSFDSITIGKEIESLEDDADYERLVSRIHKEFEQNHNRLPAYFDRVQEKFGQIRKQIQKVSDMFLTLREVKEIEGLDLPSATSPLGRYIVPNIGQAIADFRKTSKELLDRLDKQIMRFTYSKQRKPHENIALSLEGWGEANNIEGEDKTLLATAQNWGQKLKDYDKWRKMLKESDKLHTRLLDLKKDAEHQDKAEELFARFNQISEEISSHIELRNVDGLSNHPQFNKQFEELELARQDYITNLKGLFDKDKDKVNQFIEQLKLDDRVKVVFNPLDIVKSYEQLYTDGVQIIQDKGVKQVLHEIAIQKRELIYARDILRAITNDKAQSHLANSHEQYEIIMALKDEITQEWLRLVIKQDDQTQIQRISQGTANAFEIVQQIRKKVGTITKPKKPTDGRIKIMYESIPERGSINLKDLILQIMANEGEDSAQVLDVSLESLAELFRDNCVQINVERRTR